MTENNPKPNVKRRLSTKVDGNDKKVNLKDDRSKPKIEDEEQGPNDDHHEYMADTDSEDENEEKLAVQRAIKKQEEKNKKIENGEMEDDEETDDSDDDMGEDDGDQPQRVFRPGVDKLEDGEKMDYDPQAYEMLHLASSEWPCLSLDVVKDKLGENRSKYPMTTFLVAGTQAEKQSQNKILIMKWSQLSKTEKDDSDAESDSDEDDTQNPKFDFRTIPHRAAINRIRAMPQGPVVSLWSEDGHVHMYSIKKEMEALDNPSTIPDFRPKPLYTFQGHLDEGFALAWNPHTASTGHMLSGDCRGSIAHYIPSDAGWTASLLANNMHESSVEDIAWKIQGDGCPHVWASASVDQHVSIWDIRQKSMKPNTKIHAHETDINVISWNPKSGNLLLTGADDGAFKIFDVRNPEQAMAHFQWHKDQITSVDWHPTDDTVLTIASADGGISIWDVAVEDDMDGQVPQGAEHFPPQLLFLHQGQEDPKEVKFHPQIPGVILSTGSNGFNIFKSCNM